MKERNGYVRSIDIAHETGFSKPSVSRAVSILKKEGLVEIDPLNQILLTDKVEKSPKEFTKDTEF